MFGGNVILAVCCWLCSLIFWGIAIWAFKRKDPMHFWSGSTVKPEEITDITSYNRANGLMWAIYALCTVLAGILSLFNTKVGLVFFLIICLPGIGVLVFVYNRIYNKYKSTSYSNLELNNKDSSKKKSKALNTIKYVITIIIFLAMGPLFYFSEKEPDIRIYDDHLQIKAMYGLNVDVSEILDINLIEKSMKDIGAGRRTNGYGGFGDTLKGHFRSDTLGETLLFVRANSSPTIHIKRADKRDIYISLRSSEKTVELYQELMEHYR